MILLPAIDILDGQVVRLTQGDYHRSKIYNTDPVAQAREFAEQGATWIHIVDLNGAKSGVPENLALIQRIIQEVGLKAEVGGGIRSLETLNAYDAAGVSRMVLGTALIKNPDLVRQATNYFGDKIVAGIDARGGEVAIEGWREGAGIPAIKLAQDLAGLGIDNLIYTDISRDGMQTGIDVDAYCELAEITGAHVVASGGVSTLDDLRILKESGCVWGAIVGRALYEGSFTVADAVRLLSEDGQGA